MSTSPDLVGDNVTNKQAQPENCATIESSNKHRKVNMTNYEVGDTVEEINPDGEVEDTGVVTKIEEYAGISPVVSKVWAMWENDPRELNFPSDHPRFRIKVKRKVEPEITRVMVSKVLLKYRNRYTECGRHSMSQLILIAEEIFQSLQSDQQELQRQKDPEYQKYLELKKKFEPT